METFEGKSVDGYTICMRITECGSIAFGTRFDEHSRVYVTGITKVARRVKLDWCFDWFKNYAPLLTLDEQRIGFQFFKRAVSICSDDRRNAFWRFMDGYKLRAHGKHAIRYVK